ncbi:type IX secretion system protein PorQ [Chitinophaga pendula]|uniref:type IX secretion system protein PorQ n=1 Tax=Chitinophaga TaxID=79328 RepID=UPI000BB04862|nr:MULTISPECIES: type IX secretion system protein PorQ [Chitinophaga]ASZ11669.1 hypothetical protein CK934_12210 [Chitinophaga sp. MD30]UCJ05318.1 type IX secretion system protein PorQ [Chitinophaga pendula]
MRIYLILFLFLFPAAPVMAQLLGGQSVYSFLELPVSPQLTALGQVNVSQQHQDITLSAMNPALLRPAHDGQLSASYARYFGDVQYGHAMGGYYAEGIGMTFAGGIRYINYGNLTHTDAGGNVLGTFTPRDMVVQVSASRRYLQRWRYGVTVKYISSRYQVYRSSGIGVDVGITYQDTTHGLQIGLVAKNMGGQLRAYVSGMREPLPFDLQIGISKRLTKVPLQLSAALHHIHQFDIQYGGAGIDGEEGSKGSGIDRFFRHAVVSAQWYIGRYVELDLGYNHLLRKELAWQQAGLSGFSGGVGIVTRKLQLRYARSWFQQGRAFNQLGVQVSLPAFRMKV